VAAIPVKKNEATAARRRVRFNCVDATDGMTPEIGEGGGQPEISVDGAQWTVTGIGVLVDIHATDAATHTGSYYAELTQAIVNADDAIIATRYKSANTAQCYGDVAVVDARLESVAAVKTVTDLLAGMYETDGAVKRWTANALEMAPVTSTSGLATSAEITALDGVVDTVKADTAAIAAVAVDVGSILEDTGTTLPAALAAMGAADITLTSPVAASGVLTIYQGDDYATEEARQIIFAVADAAHALLLDGGTVSLKLREATWEATDIAETASGYNVVFEPTSVQTAVLTKPSQNYELEAVLANGHVVTLATGKAVLVADIPEVEGGIS
jgi:hypothetical protein